MTPILEVHDLFVEYRTRRGRVRAVNGASLSVERGEILGVAGESGCGKTATVLATLRLLPPAGQVISGQVLYDGRDVLRLPGRELRALRGREIGAVFQDPLTALHPSVRVGAQIAEAVRIHDRRVGRRQAWERALELLDLVGVPDADVRARQYPHQWSGGMRQRATIAMAIANRPRLLVADEPTSALDVTIQAQIVDVLRTARRETGAAAILITHDLGLLAQLADRVAVMYGGRVVEVAGVDEIFSNPRHPYTAGLLASLPRLDGGGSRLESIPGQPPALHDLTPGCCFEPRCWLGQGRRRCQERAPAMVTCGCADHRCECHFFNEVAVRRR